MNSVLVCGSQAYIALKEILERHVKLVKVAEAAKSMVGNKSAKLKMALQKLEKE